DAVAGIRDDARCQFRGHPSTITPPSRTVLPYTPLAVIRLFRPRSCAPLVDLGGGARCRRVGATEDRRSSSCANTRIEALLSRGPRRCHRDSLPRTCSVRLRRSFFVAAAGGRGRCHAAAWHPYT